MTHRTSINNRRNKTRGRKLHRIRKSRKLLLEPLESRWLLAGHSGPALALDGIDDYAPAPDHPTLDLGIGSTEDFTIEASVYVPSADYSGNKTLVNEQTSGDYVEVAGGGFDDLATDNVAASGSPTAGKSSAGDVSSQAASTNGFTWHDLNANGVQDTGESGIAGAVVELFGSTNAIIGDGDDVSLGAVITDDEGTYRFGDLPEFDNYYIVVRPPVAFTFTAQGAGGDPTLDSDVNAVGVCDLFVLSAGDVTLDAGLVGTAPGFGFALAAGSTGIDRGEAIATDADGSVYVIGRFQGTVDFDPGPGVVNVTSRGGSDIFVAKYTAAGALMWARAMGSASNDYGWGIAVDGAGNVYTTGYFQGTADFDPGASTFNLTSSGGEEIFVSKLDNSGNFVWARALGGTSGDRGRGIAVDGAGNVYTTGTFQGTADFDTGPGIFHLNSNGGNDIFVSKLDSAGNFVWARSMGGTSDDDGDGIAVDGAGNVYTTGYFQRTVDFDPGAGTFHLTNSGLYDIFVSKLDNAGNFVWARSMGGAGYDRGAGIAVDGAGNVYTTGEFQDTADFDPGPSTFNLTSSGGYDVFVSKLDDAGNFVWAKAQGGTSGDGGYGIAVDGPGNVYTSGTFRGMVDFDPGPGTFHLTSNGTSDIFVSKLDSTGNFVWAKAIGGTSDDSGLDIAVDGAGNVHTTGYFQATADFAPGTDTFTLTSSGGYDIFVSKLVQTVARTLSAELDPGGNLTISDIDATGKNNLLSIHNDGAGNLVVSDANGQFTGTGGIAGAILNNGNRTLTVPLASISGTQIIIHGAGGDDTLAVDLTTPLGKAVDFHGGDGDDALVLIGGSTHTSTFTYLSASNGSVTLDPDGPGPLEPWTVTYTGLAPITSSIASDVVELIYTGGDETISISDAGGGQTTAVSALGGLTTFINPTELLRIVANNGMDTINIGALAASYASIEITGDDATDVVNFSGPITFAPNHGLTVAGVGTVNLPHTTSDIIASGTGAVSITALGNIALASGASITAVDGDISLSANQQATPTAGTFTGISLDGASVSATGAGSITLAGRGGTVGENFGIQIENEGQVNGNTGTSRITLIADSMTLTSTTAVDGGSNAVVLRASTAGTLIDLGGADVLTGSPLTLGLSHAELDRITAGTLTIGHAASGAIIVSAAISRPLATDVRLISAGGIVLNPASIDTAGGELVLDSGTAVEPLTAGTELTATKISFVDGSKLAIQIDGTTVDSQYTQLNVAGGVDLTGAVLALSGSYTPAVGDAFTIVNNEGSDPIFGTFAGLDEGAMIPNFLGSGLVATITYVGGDGNDVVLEVQAAEAVGVQMVAVAIPSAAGSTTLPSSLDMVALGSTYYVEVWVQDRLTPGVGISGGKVDVNYTTAVADAVDVLNLDFDMFPDGTIDDPLGLVNDLGGGTLTGGRGIAPQWARLGYVEFVATDLGQATFELSPGAMQFGRFGVGNVAWDLVDLGTPIVVEQIGGTRIDMTIVHEPSTIGDNGEVASLPASAGWVHEWQSFWVEIWVSTPDTTTLAVAGASVDLQYPTGFTTAQQIEHGPAFTLDRTGTIADGSGLVSAIGGRTALTNVGDDAHVLLARVRFESTGNDQVAVDQAGQNIGPYDMQLALESGQTEVVAAGAVVPVLGDTPATELWAVVYDIDDNNQVDFGDLAMFAPAFGRSVGVPASEPPYVWWADFDKTSQVDFGDLAFFAPNFGKTRSAVQDGTQALVFPTNFPDAWRAMPAAPGGEGEGAAGGEMQEQPATGLGAQVPAAADAMFAQLGIAEEARTPPWLRPRVATAGRKSSLIEAPQQAESPVHPHSRSDSSTAAPAARLQRCTEHWEPLEDLLSLLADQPSDRLLDLYEALFAQAGR